MKIQVPSQVCSDAEGFSFFAYLLAKTKSEEFEKIIIDFSKTTWFEANLCSILGACIAQIEDAFNVVSIENLNDRQYDIFSRNRFLSHYGGQTLIDFNETTISYRSYKNTDDKLFKKYLDDELLIKPELPNMSSMLKRKIGESIFELFTNAITHGASNKVFTCGQYYPRKVPPRIDFTLVDLGKTIKTNVTNFLKVQITASEAIEWAFEPGNTTKVGDIPGGLGLKLIRDFLSLNNGKIQVMSDKGYWEHVKGEIKKSDLDYSFPGTIVNIEFNVSDTSSYYLEEEIDLEELF